MSATEFPGASKSQGASLKSSWRFVAQEKLPRIDAGTTFKETYSQLTRSGGSGFLLSDSGKVRGYVKGDELAAVVVQQAQGDAQQLREYSAKQIGDVITQFAAPLVPVAPIPAGATEGQLHAIEETVFEILEDERQIGWYLNHETVLDATTKKTVFICTNGHVNPDPDHGTCYSCPFPIVLTDSKS
jgi:hypothetical protein